MKTLGTALIAASANAVATVEANPWLQAAADSNDFDGQFVKLNGNTGEYSYGQAGEELAVGSTMAINMPGVMHGYICWKEGTVVDRALSLVESGQKPPLSSLADHGPYEKHEDGTEDGWSENHQIPMANSDGDKFMLQASSDSAVRSVKRFYSEYGKKRSQHIDDDGNYMVPVVELEVGSFVSKNKRAGKKYYPVLKIVEWIAVSQVADLFESSIESGGDNPEDYAEAAQATAPAAKKRAPRAAKPQPEPEPEVVAEPEPEVVAEPEPTPAPVAAKPAGFGAKLAAAKAEPVAETQTVKAATNAAAAAAAQGGRRAKRF